MAIAKRVLEAFQKATSGDFEAAMVPTCIAVDATTKREHPDRNVGDRFKTFLRDNAWIIGFLGLQIVAKQIRVRLDHPDLREDASGTVLLEEVLYHVVRCGLIHEADFGTYVALSTTTLLGYDGSRVVVHQPDAWVIVHGEKYLVNELWGKRDSFIPALQYRVVRPEG